MAIGRLEGKVDGFLTSQLNQDARLDKLDDRIRINEKWVSRVAGALVFATSTLAGLIAYFRS